MRLILLLRELTVRLVRLFIVATLIALIGCILLQDLLVFPGMTILPWRFSERSSDSLPIGAESISVPGDGGRTIELVRFPATAGTPKEKVAILFHGNGGPIDSFFPEMEWFAEQGYTVYGLEYRGYGHTRGWPSARGIMSDSEAAVEAIVDREKIDAREMTSIGFSLGTGFAAYVANHFRMHALVMMAPYAGLREVARTRPRVGFLSAFMWNDVPTREYISQLRDTCVVAAHGKHDAIIPYSQSLELRNAYQGTRSYHFLSDDTANHMTVFYVNRANVAQALAECETEHGSLLSSP